MSKEEAYDEIRTIFGNAGLRYKHVTAEEVKATMMEYTFKELAEDIADFINLLVSVHDTIEKVEVVPKCSQNG